MVEYAIDYATKGYDCGFSTPRWHVAPNGKIEPLNEAARYVELGCPTRRPPGWTDPVPELR